MQAKCLSLKLLLPLFVLMMMACQSKAKPQYPHIFDDLGVQGDVLSFVQSDYHAIQGRDDSLRLDLRLRYTRDDKDKFVLHCWEANDKSDSVCAGGQTDWFLRSSYTYDSDGRMIKWIDYVCLVSEYTIKYIKEDDGRVRELSYLDDALLSTAVLTYDKNGRLLMKENNDEDGSQKERTTYHYDAQGLKTQTIIETLDSPRSKATIRYNQQGHEVEESCWLEGASQKTNPHLYRYEYVYDAQGNWIERKEYNYLDGKPMLSMLVKREFEYQSKK